MYLAKFPNGAEYFLAEHPVAKLVAIQCWVRVGSLHEEAHERGLSHLIEHMLFKGTARRAVGEIARTVEECGGEINAYTTFDRTVYYLTVASKFAELGIDLLADALFHSAFDPQELENEKEVVIEEIRRSLDNPANAVGRRIFSEMFKGTEASRPIIGFEEQVDSYTREEVYRFYKKWYQPQNFTVVVVGDFEWQPTLSMLESSFGAVKGDPLPVASVPAPQVPQTSQVVLLKGDYQQPRLEVAFAGPSEENLDAVALDLAAFALSSGDAARLNRTLRDRDGVVSAAGASLYSPKFGGIFEISLQTSKDLYLTALEGIGRELAELKYMNPVSADELQRARITLKTDRILQSETVTGLARVLGYGLTTPFKQYYDEINAALVNQLHPSDIDQAIHRWLDESKVLLVGLVPDDAQITEESMQEAFWRGFNGVKNIVASQRARKLPAAVAKMDEMTRLPTHRLKLDNGMTLIYRENPRAGVFNMVAVAEGGLRAEVPGEEGIFYAFSELLGRGTEKATYEDILEQVEGRGAALYGFSGKDSFGLKLQCLNEHVDDLFGLWCDSWLHPKFPEEQWESVKRDIFDSIRAENDSPSQIAIKNFQRLLFQDHPYGWPIYGRAESVGAFTLNRLLHRFQVARDGSPWVVAATGSLPLERVAEQLNLRLGAAPMSQLKGDFPYSNGLLKSPMAVRQVFKKDREQAHLVVGSRGLTWGDPDRAALDVLINILGGSGGRLFINLRDRRSLAYSVSPFVTYGCHPGLYALYIGCAPDKAAEAEQSLVAELETLAAQAPSAEELKRSINYIVGGHEADLQRNDAQAMTMALMEAYGHGYDDYARYAARIEEVTVADVLRVAQRLISRQDLIKVIVEP